MLKTLGWCLLGTGLVIAAIIVIGLLLTTTIGNLILNILTVLFLGSMLGIGLKAAYEGTTCDRY